MEEAPLFSALCLQARGEQTGGGITSCVTYDTTDTHTYSIKVSIFLDVQKIKPHVDNINGCHFFCNNHSALHSVINLSI